MKTREEKIKYLKDLQAGKVSLQSVKPKQRSVLFNKNNIREIEAYFIDGSKVSQEEFFEESERQKEKGLPIKTNLRECEVGPEDEYIKNVMIDILEGE